MRGVLVAFDLETTGLNPLHDDIIEIGAVRIQNGEILEEFGTFINPGRAIPATITHITGIRTEDVMNAPTIDEVLPDLVRFAGDAPLIAHNIAFDVGFLAKYRALQTNLRIDTYDLASVLLPRAPRYNLNSIATMLGIELEMAHRALDDARAAALAYWQLWQKLLSLPYPTINEIVAASRDLSWGARIPFEAALQEIRPQSAAAGFNTDPTSVFYDPAAEEEFDVDTRDWGFNSEDDFDAESALSAQPDDDRADINLDDTLQMIGPEGPLATSISGYEFRPQQVQMTRAIVNAFNNSEHLMVEAGTGTGKSIAYLVPAILWAVQNNRRVVISTNTINLQEQLINKDIPMLQETLGIHFSAALIKGRANYLCPRRLTALRRRKPTSVDELRTLANILVWLLESKTGDRGEISLRGPAENSMWQRLSAEDEGCKLDHCLVAMQGICPFYKARRSAENAHLLIVNHALLIIDAMTDNHVLPDYKYLILDEAHHLEDAITNGLSFRLDEFTMRRRLADLGGTDKGLLGAILGSLRGSIPEREFRRVDTFVERISEATSVMEVHIEALFINLRTFIEELDNSRESEFSTQVRVTSQLRGKNSFASVTSAWSVLSEFLEAISDAMVQLSEALSRMSQYDIPNYDDYVTSSTTAGRQLHEMHKQLEAFTTKPDENTIYWVNVSQNNTQISVHSAPLHIGDLMEQHVWGTKESVVMTSATLRTSDSFDYIRERLNAEYVDTIEVGSPFNYRDSTLIYIPNDVPEPNERQLYQQAVERGIIELAGALDGRVLGLFTSYTQLRQTAQAITPRLALGNITVYDQSDGSSRQAQLDGFMSTEKAVLLGTKSFWEGVDIPGETLSALVIVRLPFSVPSEPVFAARSETYSNSFSEFAVPEAILRFRQGFGRLIRTKTDRGVVAIFDRRVITKGYGATFLQSLPDCTVQYGTVNGLADAARKWLNRAEPTNIK
ncbi:MAG: DEAD/DEAH box helicase [Burkholderiales bacterium]|nr:DEAD/DEAH box helicase [Anaerolineae bacterium]